MGERRQRKKEPDAVRTSPFGFINRRFAGLHGHVSNQTEIVERGLHHLDVRLDTLETNVVSHVHESHLLREQLFHDTETLSELSTGFERLAIRLEGRVADAVEALDRLTDRVEPGDLALPLIYAVAANLATDCRVLDIGGARSSRVLALAALGLQVTALDVRASGCTHPNLVAFDAPLEEWVGPQKPFHAVFCTTTLEWLSALDAVVVDRIASWTVPGGELVAAVPFGVADTDGTRKVYDATLLDKLFAAWKVVDLRIFDSDSGGVWQPVDPSAPAPVDRGQRVAVLRLLRGSDVE